MLTLPSWGPTKLEHRVRGFETNPFLWHMVRGAQPHIWGGAHRSLFISAAAQRCINQFTQGCFQKRRHIWAPVASSEWYIPNFLWKWSSAHRVTDISFSSSNDWLSKAQQDNCSAEHVKLLCTLDQPTTLWEWPWPYCLLGEVFPTYETSSWRPVLW